ncbi:hypothetical protein EJB05_46590, partial [Eragrostis curvula]
MAPPLALPARRGAEAERAACIWRRGRSVCGALLLNRLPLRLAASCRPTSPSAIERHQFQIATAHGVAKRRPIYIPRSQFSREHPVQTLPRSRMPSSQRCFAAARAPSRDVSFNTGGPATRFLQRPLPAKRGHGSCAVSAPLASRSRDVSFNAGKFRSRICQVPQDITILCRSSDKRRLLALHSKEMAQQPVFSLLERIGSIAADEAKYLWGVSDKLESAKRQLQRMQAFLKDLDDKMLKGGAMARNLVSEVREVVFQLEDIIDDANIFRRQSDPNTSIRRAVSKYACFPVYLTHLHKLGARIDSAIARMKTIFEDFERFNIVATAITEEPRAERIEDEAIHQLRSIRPDFGVQVDVIGFDDQVNQIKNYLLDGEQKHLAFASIVGPGGAGKSTMAMQVYGLDAVKRHFNILAWITVSQRFIPHDLLKELVKGTMELHQGQGLEKKTVQELKKLLHDSLLSKRYLIVLDDVWSTTVWDIIRDAFPDEKNGSRIILTTRNEAVAQHPNARKEIYMPKLLNEDESTRLLLSRAIPEYMLDGTSNSHAAVTVRQDLDKFKELGKDLTVKCRGLPLALIVLGGYLSRNLDVAEWRRLTSIPNIFGITYIKMHDILHDWGIGRARREGFVKDCRFAQDLEVAYPEEMVEAYRVAFHVSKEDEVRTSVRKHRTLLYLSTHLGAMGAKLFKHFRHLRVLYVEASENEVRLPSEISQMRYLRYLGFGSSFTTYHLPSSIGDLLSLETLYATFCNIDYIPGSLWKIPTLTQVYIQFCSGWSVSRRISSLSKVHVAVGCFNEDAEDASQTERMIEATKHQLSKNKNPNFSFYWTANYGDGIEIAGRCGEAVRLPNPTILIPSWVLKICCPNLLSNDQDILMLERLNLHVLEIGELSYIGSVMNFRSGSFKNLKWLMLHDLAVGDWKIEHGSLKRLKLLTLCKCPNLTRLPEGLLLLPDLGKIELIAMPPSCYEQGTVVQQLKEKGCVVFISPDEKNFQHLNLPLADDEYDEESLDAAIERAMK